MWPSGSLKPTVERKPTRHSGLELIPRRKVAYAI